MSKFYSGSLGKFEYDDSLFKVEKDLNYGEIICYIGDPCNVTDP